MKKLQLVLLMVTSTFGGSRLLATEELKSPLSPGGTQTPEKTSATTSKATDQKGLDVIDNYGDFVLIEADKNTRYLTPKSIHSSGSYSVRIKRAMPKPVVAKDKKEPSQEDKIQARKLMFLANQAFFKGEFQKVWELVDQAEALDADFYRIKSMKGSLLYRIGSKDLAVSLWRDSLKINPNQPDIVELLNNTQKELGTK